MTAPSEAAPAVPTARRRPALLLLTAALVLGGAAYGAWWWLTQRHVETTDNAYVQAPVVQVTPQVAGTVQAVLVDDTDRVAAGQTLVRLDAADARLALARAEAQLAQAVREVQALYGNDASLDSTVRQREAELARVQAELARASADVERRRPLLASGAVGAEELQHAEAALAALRGQQSAAQSALAAARAQAVAGRALTAGTTPDSHPAVAQAAAAVREAWLALQRTELKAPVAGQVVRRTVQLGQRLAAGAPLLSLVPLDQVWVDANFKEGQLRRMRIGQPVTLRSDLHGRDVIFRGRVAGLGAGTGAAFALLPAQNATGNWIKIVQRVPVRITLDARDLAAHPLRVGLSMHASVDVADDGGAPLAAGTAAALPAAPATAASTAASAPAAAAAASAPALDEADRRVRAIIAGQLGRAVRP